MQRVVVESKVLRKNEEMAAQNRALFARYGVVAINVMSAPGAGKTSLLEQTIRHLSSPSRVAVIEGDLQTEIDTVRIRALGVRARQIITGTVCHLDACMIDRALADFPLSGIDTLFIENVGNMVCPAEFDLGEHLRVMVYSVPEGAEKPKKYPLMFHQAHTILLNKIDLLPYSGVSLEELICNVREVNPRTPVFPLSCRTGEGLNGWLAWLHQAVALQRMTLKSGIASCV